MPQAAMAQDGAAAEIQFAIRFGFAHLDTQLRAGKPPEQRTPGSFCAVGVMCGAPQFGCGLTEFANFSGRP